MLRFSDYLRMLGRRWLLIGVGTTVVAAVAVAMSVGGLPQYEASATILVQPPLLSNASYSGSVLSFAPVIKNRTLGVQIVEEFDLQEGPHNLSALEFSSSNVVVEAIPNTTMLNVTVRLTDADLAARVVNRLCELAVERYAQRSEDERHLDQKFLEVELANARERMEPLQDLLQQQVDRASTSGAGEDGGPAPLGGLRDPLTTYVELYRQQVLRAQLELDYFVAKQVYSELRTKYGNPEADAAAQSLRLYLFDRALPPERPLPTQHGFRVAGSTLLALLFFAGVALWLEHKP